MRLNKNAEIKRPPINTKQSTVNSQQSTVNSQQSTVNGAIELLQKLNCADKKEYYDRLLREYLFLKPTSASTQSPSRVLPGTTGAKDRES